MNKKQIKFEEAVVIGDVHGDLNKVMLFLKYKPEVHHIFTGDLIDSFHVWSKTQLEMLDLLMETEVKWSSVWGNHDIHYLKDSPFRGSGFQHELADVYRAKLLKMKSKFSAALILKDWIITHAGISDTLAKHDDIEIEAKYLNEMMNCFLRKPKLCGQSEIFRVGRGRGGVGGNGGIFWFDFLREQGLSQKYKQIFGHTEITRTYGQPHWQKKYGIEFMCLDVTNSKDTWIYDSIEDRFLKLN